MKARKEEAATLRFRNRPAWVVSITNDTTGAVDGARFTWLDGPYACSPDQHYTNDYGDTFRKMTGYLLTDGTMLSQQGDVETSREKIEALKDLWVAYQLDRGWPVFCP